MAAQLKTYIIENLGCANCAAKMERKINELPEVEEAVIVFATKQLRIKAEDPDSLLEKIQKICSDIEDPVKIVPAEKFSSSSKERALHHEHHEHKEDCGCGHSHRHNHHDHEEACNCGHEHHDHEHHSHESADNDKSVLHEVIPIIAGAVFFAVGILCEYLPIPAVISIVILIADYIFLGRNVILTAAKSIGKRNVFDENFLMSVATIAAICIGDFPEAVGVMLFYRVGELFEDIAVNKSRSQIMSAIDMRPETVTILNTEGTTEIISAEEAEVGDIIIVRPGDRIPLDGVIIDGSSMIDTSAVTGEPVPVSVAPGSEVFSGCVNTSGLLKLKVEKELSESMVTRILDSVENAAASKPKIDRFITKFARIYTPIVVAVAIFTAIVPSLITGDWNKWIYTAITFLVISCPCALVLSIPLAFFSGIGSGSKRGILFKGGVAIEALKNVKAVVMDKTGTITKGNFKLLNVVALSDISEKDLLIYAAGVEQNSTHPIARSIVTAAKEKGLSYNDPDSIEEISGKGIKAVFGDTEILCGNNGLMEHFGIDTKKYAPPVAGTEVLIAVSGRLAGYMLIDDEIKPESASAIRSLKALGLKTAMLTGDAESNATAVAEKLGIDEVHAKLLPDDKLKKLTEIRRKNGSVMFIGDGINDAPVLAGADVGAAMGSGADAAIEAADVVFMNSSLDAVVTAVNISRKTNIIAIENVVFALFIKALTMILGLLGFANMWFAVFADTGVAIICILNSIRAMKIKENR